MNALMAGPGAASTAGSGAAAPAGAADAAAPEDGASFAALLGETPSAPGNGTEPASTAAGDDPATKKETRKPAAESASNDVLAQLNAAAVLPVLPVVAATVAATVPATGQAAAPAAVTVPADGGDVRAGPAQAAALTSAVAAPVVAALPVAAALAGASANTGPAASAAATTPALSTAPAFAVLAAAGKNGGSLADDKASPECTTASLAADTSLPAQAIAAPAAPVTTAPALASIAQGVAPFPAGPLSAPVRADGLLPAPDKPASVHAHEESLFAEAIGSRITWLAGERIGRADINLSPPGLGPVRVSLDLDDKQVRAEFYSAQPEIRAALEAGLPRLRDMLSGQGLQLTHAGVGSGSQDASGNPGSSRASRQHTAAGESRDEAPATLTGKLLPRLHSGLLDEYA